jgi:ligand-binding sensor domain-containing protein
MIKITRLSLFFLFFCFRLSAQVYSFKTYSVEDGLPRSHVQSVFQDREGNLWIGSLGGGVSRFNGKAFVTYSSRNGLVSNDVNVIFQSSDGVLWFGTNNGVSSFDGKEFRSYTRAQGLCSNVIISVFEDSRKDVWFRSFEEGVSVLRRGSGALVSYTASSGLPDNLVFDIKEDRIGNIWLACFKGLVRVNRTGKTEVYTAEDGLGSDRVSSLMVDRSGSLLIGTWEAGIRICAEEKGRAVFRKYSNDPVLNSLIVLSMVSDNKGDVLLATLGNGLVKLSGGRALIQSAGRGDAVDYLNRIYQDSRGNIWLISSDESLFRIDRRDYDSGRWRYTHFSTRNGLSDDRIITFTEDREGNMWFGTYTGGVCRYNGDLFTGLTLASGLTNSSVTAFCSDRSGRLWIGTDGGGVNIVGNDGRISSPGSRAPARGSFVSALLLDRKGNVWQGTSDDGVSVHGPSGEITSYTKYSGLSTNKVFSIKQDSKGQIWICTDAGLTLYNGRLVNYSEGRALLTRSIGGMAESQTGELWFPGHDTILEVYSGGLFRHYALPYKLSGAIIPAAGGTMLLGTEDNGVVECHLGKTFTHRLLISPQEINFTTVNSLVMDEAGSLWVGTSKGIYRFEYSRYLQKKTGLLKEYGKEEGLISLVTNKNAAYIDKSGTLWVGTIKGALRIDRKKISLNKKEPVTSITGVRLFFDNSNLKPYSNSVDEKSGLPGGLSLPYFQNHLTFDFIGVSLTAPGRVKYRYRMAGLDSKWSPERQETFVTYSNLPPGNYTFMVIACNNDGLWNTTPAEFSFSIVPPYWKTWWFIAFCVITLSAAVYLLFNWRVRHIKNTAVLRQKILESEQKALRAQMNPHFIFNSLNSIQHFITDKDVKSANRYLSKFSKLMRMILDNSRKPFISLAEELESLKLYLDLEALRFENKFEYSIDISEEVDIHSVEIPPMLIQPYLENTIWHGFSHKKDKGLVRISFGMEEGLLVCSIEDNGIGRKKSQELKISHPAQHNSSGMRITSERLQSVSALKSIQGSVEVLDLENDAGEGLGTLVKIRIPID